MQTSSKLGVKEQREKKIAVINSALYQFIEGESKCTHFLVLALRGLYISSLKDIPQHRMTTVKVL